MSPNSRKRTQIRFEEIRLVASGSEPVPNDQGSLPATPCRESQRHEDAEPIHERMVATDLRFSSIRPDNLKTLHRLKFLTDANGYYRMKSQMVGYI